MSSRPSPNLRMRLLAMLAGGICVFSGACRKSGEERVEEAKAEPETALKSEALPARDVHPDGTPLFAKVDAATSGVEMVAEGDVRLVDVDGDGRVDLQVDGAEGTVTFLQSETAWRFEERGVEPVSLSPAVEDPVAQGDFNADGIDDVLVAGAAHTTHYRRMVAGGGAAELPNRLLLNSADGGVREVAWLAGVARTGDVGAVVAGDFDLDGRADLFFANGSSLIPEANLAFRGLEGLAFEELGATWGVDDAGASRGAAAADVDGDGDLDLVVAMAGQPLAMFRNGSGEARISVRLLADKAASSVGAEVKVVHSVGVQRKVLAEGQEALWFGFGGLEKVERLQVTWPDGRVQEFSDLAVDQRLTVRQSFAGKAAAPAGDEPRGARFGDVLALLKTDDAPARGAAFSVIDLDNDADPDLCVGGSVWLNDGSGGFAMVEGMGGDGAAAAEAFDADGDGALDLYLATASGGKIGDKVLLDRLYRNDGKGGFSPADADALPDLRDVVACVRLSDVDGDGDLDLFVGGGAVAGGYPAACYSRILINVTEKDGPVRYDVAAAETSPGLREVGIVSDALWRDCDGDGDRDLLLISQWGAPRLFVNEGGGRFAEGTEAAGLAELGGWWSALAAGDLDGDGDIDFVLGNRGLNAEWAASQREPALVYFPENQSHVGGKAIEAYFEGGRIYPRADREASVSAWPSIAEKVPTVHDFAGATLEEIFGADALAEMIRLEVTTAASGVLINDGAGRFGFAPFPDGAQLAAVAGLMLVDIDSDGDFDVVSADGYGTVLINDGAGGFAVESLATGGVAGAIGVGVHDIDGDAKLDLVWPMGGGEVRWQRGL